MSGRATYWIATVIIAVGAALSWIGFLGPQWITFVGAVGVLAGALVLVFARTRRRDEPSR
jgi:general stress protein CsbA